MSSHPQDGRRAPAPHRRGEPGPLVFHLAAALAGYQQALIAAPNARDGRFPWSPHLQQAAAELGGEIDRLALAREIGARLSAMLRGIELWQAHPYRRTLAPPPAIWSRGSCRLFDYGLAPEAADPRGLPVLVVPSLINRAYILDLLPERSLLRWLAARGVRPVLLDWGDPGPEERGFDLDAYGTERLRPALAHLAEEAGRPAAVVGYCMGGTLAAGLAARSRENLSALATIGAPWDFAATTGLGGGLRAMVRAEGAERAETLVTGVGEAFGAVPLTVFEHLFALINPMQAAVKFQRFARLAPDTAAARHFVALEDWLTDGVPMATPAARDLLVGWQIRNQTATGRWHFLGGTVHLWDIRIPALAFCGQSDTIAPAPIALPLARAIPGARIVAPPTGHVGMVVGSAASRQVWRPLADFLAAHPG
jgi:polyhydroxyalkanoate synthase subunit PhaC